MRTYRRWFALFLVVFFGVLVFSATAPAQVVVSVGFAPPELPVYEQPICPGDGYIWTPGYWAWDGEDYYWVPGTWVLAPEVGFFWTPPYWGWGGSAFIFHEGYWGPHVGFYGGINYGFGYFGDGFVGGRWDGGHFFYNRSVTNVNVTIIHNVYNTRIENFRVNHVSYNGGEGGINARPSSRQEQWEHERHVGPVAAQTQHIQEARNNQQLRASYNHGKPPIAATARPASFNEGVTKGTSAAHYNPPARVAGNPTRAAVHPSDLAPHNRQEPANTGNAQRDQQYEQQRQQLNQRQEQEHQQLQQKQEQEHQQAQRQHYNQAQQQQMEQRHQQQTQQMEQRHVQEQQHVEQQHQQHQQPAHENPKH
jgi:hypothetical protein